MPIINCPECGGVVSSQAEACPKCGFELDGGDNENSNDYLRAKEICTFIIILGIFGFRKLKFPSSYEPGTGDICRQMSPDLEIGNSSGIHFPPNRTLDHRRT